MAKSSQKKRMSDQTKEDAMKIARGTQKPGQTREQTRLIAQGIQKGIEQYKRKQSEKKRELDKKLKKASARIAAPESSVDIVAVTNGVKPNKLPWVLLLLTWIGFAVYFFQSMMADWIDSTLGNQGVRLEWHLLKGIAVIADLIRNPLHQAYWANLCSEIPGPLHWNLYSKVNKYTWLLEFKWIADQVRNDKLLLILCILTAQVSAIRVRLVDYQFWSSVGVFDNTVECWYILQHESNQLTQRKNRY